MAYLIRVDGQSNIGLHPWLTGMAGNAVDVEETETNHTIQGVIVRTDPPGTPNAQVTLVSCDLSGRAHTDGMLMHIKIENITEVAVW